MKTAGLVLDFYDDRMGETLKSVCPTPEDLPEAVKTAHFLSPDERDVLRDEAFALILHNDGKQLRKFACIDPGNTVLSTLYFMEHFDRLPAEAVKTAAVNLISFNEDFDLPVPDMLKLAAETGMSAKTASSFQEMNKIVDKMKPGKALAYAAPKMAQREQGRKAAQAIAAGKKWKGMTKVSNIVDVSVLEPAPYTEKKMAKLSALGGEYSLDRIEDVKEAIIFFSENWPSLDPKDRHEFAVKTAARAEELMLSAPEILERYGSTEYGPDVEAHLANRRSMAPHFKAVWDDLQEKRAMLEPEQFAELLAEADELSGLKYEWGGAVYDPYYATFGGRGSEKIAAAAYEDPDSGEAVTYEELSDIPREVVEKNFTPDFAEAFAADPKTIFDSMPATTKQVIVRMAKGS